MQLRNAGQNATHTVQDGFDRGLIGQGAGRIQQASISIFGASHTMGALRRSPLACGFARAPARRAACVDRSILEHLLKTEQIIAIRWRVSTLQRDRLMANSPQLGGAERTGKTGHSVLDWFSQNNMPLGGASQESRGNASLQLRAVPEYLQRRKRRIRSSYW